MVKNCFKNFYKFRKNILFRLDFNTFEIYKLFSIINSIIYEKYHSHCLKKAKFGNFFHLVWVKQKTNLAKHEYVYTLSVSKI